MQADYARTVCRTERHVYPSRSSLSHALRILTDTQDSSRRQVWKEIGTHAGEAGEGGVGG